MDVKEAIAARRAYRALEPVEVTDGIIRELATAAQLTASCFNNQPWRFVFARDGEALAGIHGCLNKGNEWVHRASLIIAAFAAREHDCIIKEREYYLFDLGMAVSSMQLRATELGLVAHPIAGFEPEKIRGVLGIPEGNTVITLLIVGKKSGDTGGLTQWQLEAEASRPSRLPLENICSIDRYDARLGVRAQK
ncbi:MAG: nitroreductase family protein [Spirochaetes bacterium]|nr:nitroreductase family protein [Spirochaetota bacterium]